MEKRILKRVLAVVLTGVTAFAGIQLPEVLKAEAAQTGHYEWNVQESLSGYPKVAVGEFTIAADSEQHGEEGQDGPAAHAVDGKINTYWHSNYGGENEADLENGVNNTATLELKEAQDVAGISYYPRPGLGNGLISSLSIEVFSTTSGEWEPVTSEGKETIEWDITTEEEKEIFFDEEKMSVKRIRISVHGGRGGFISAAEFSILKPIESSHVWNPYVSHSGWKKVPLDGFSVAADTEAGDENTAVGGDGPASHAKDGNIDSFWHSSHSGEQQPVYSDEAGEFTDNNTLTMILVTAADVRGITYLPRQGTDAFRGNGYIEKYSVEVSAQEGDAAEFQPAAEGNWSYANTAEHWTASLREREVLFDEVKKDVKQIRITVLQTSNESGHHINAAELSILTPERSNETIYETAEVDPEVLGRNATASSWAAGSPYPNDGEPSWAFNGVTTNWWHSAYAGSHGGGDSNGAVSADHPVWIQTGFERRLYVTELKYCSRTDNMNNGIKEYEVQTANLTDPADTPEDADFHTVASGTLAQVNTEQTIALQKDGVIATHIRLVAKSVCAGNEVTASSIKIYEKTKQTSEANVCVMMDKATANSWAAGASPNGNDGPPAYAFNGVDTNWWHSAYDGNYGGGDTDGLVSDEHPIWIQTGFGETKYVKSICYQARSGGANSIGSYDIYVANLSNPNAEPTDEDFQYHADDPADRTGAVQQGTLTATDGSEQTITLDTPVAATHIRLVARTKIGGGSANVTARKIGVSTATPPFTVIGAAEKECLPLLEVKSPAAGVAPEEVTAQGEEQHYHIATSWTASDGSEPETFEGGETYTVKATLTAEDGYMFTALSRPVEIVLDGEKAALSEDAVALQDDKTMIVRYTFDPTPGDRSMIQTEYWDAETKNGSMATQDEKDIWLYQVKESDSGTWSNLPENAFYPDYHPTSGDDGGAWMQSAAAQSEDYHWSKLARTEITASFASRYSGAAYAWRAQESGYYQAALVEPIGAARENGGLLLEVNYSTKDAPGTEAAILKAQEAYSAGDTLESRIVKAEAGDIIRFAASEGWATGFQAMIQVASAKDYARQYLEDIAGTLEEVESGKYTAASGNRVKAAVTALEELLDGEAEDAAVEEKLTALQEAVAGLKTGEEPSGEIVYRGENGGNLIPGSKTVSDEEKESYDGMTDLSADILFRYDGAVPDQNIALVTLSDGNGKFVTFWHNPQQKRYGYSASDGTVSTPGSLFWSNKGDTVTPDQWHKLTFSLTADGKFSFIQDAAGTDSWQANALSPDSCWTPVEAFLTHQWQVSEVLIGEKDTNGTYTVEIGSLADNSAALKYVKVRNSATYAEDNALVDEEIQNEYSALLSAVAELRAEDYTEASWSEFETVLTANSGKTTDWEMADGIDAITAAKEKLEPREVTPEPPAPENGLGKIDRTVLQANAKANSQQDPASGNDGPAGNAFNGEDGNWWHSRYTGTPNTEAGEIESGAVSAENPIWIQTAFGRTRQVWGLIVQGRDNGHNLVNEYEVQIATTDDPVDDDFILVKSGQLSATTAAQTIMLENAVEATAIRLVVKSIQAVDTNGDQHIALMHLDVLAEPEEGETLLEGITAAGYRETYETGDAFSTEGMSVTASYSDGKTALVDLADVTISKLDTTEAGEKKLTVTYMGKTTEITVQVEEKSVWTLDSIKAESNKGTYTVGEALDLTVTAVYKDQRGNTKEEAVDLADVQVSGYNADQAGTQTVTVTYQGKTATFEVTVKEAEPGPQEPTLVSITVTPPTKTTYVLGEAFDPAGMIVTAAYSDGSTADVTAQATVSGYDPQTVGSQTITVQYNGLSQSFTVTVKENGTLPEQPTLEGIDLTMPAKTEYQQGEALDLSGMLVTARYSDGSTKDVTAQVSVAGYDPYRAGVQTITVSYGGLSQSFTVTVKENGTLPEQPTLKELVLTPPTKTVYQKGEDLDLTGMKVIAKYSDGTEVDVTANVTVSGYDKNKAGSQTISVQYGGKTQTFVVKVNGEGAAPTGDHTPIGMMAAIMMLAALAVVISARKRIR